jgi:2-dehydro-3-deoxygluconokinase
MTTAFDLVALGEAMVEFNQLQDGDGRTYLQGFGGDTSNVVIAAARQGARCAYITRLGDDDFGRLCLALWRDEGVDASGVGIDPGAHTGIYFVRHGAAGHSFSYLRAGSAASRMQPGDVPERLLRATRLLHVSGISQAISENAERAVGHAVRLAREAGARVAYDPNLRPALWTLERARQVIIDTLPSCDEFLPSLDDLRQVSGLDRPRDIVDWSHRMGARHVVLKLGAQGALVSDGARCEAVPAFRVQSVDATGAGDCFDGSYLTRRVAGDDPVSATRWACAAAALATTGYGAVAPLPNRMQVDALLRSEALFDPGPGAR